MIRERSQLRCLASATASLAVLLLINTHALWRPWLGGFVTPAFADVVWIGNVTGLVHLLGNLLLFAVCPPLLRRSIEFLFAALALVSAAVLFRVFPFAFATEWPAVTLRVLLGVALVALGLRLIASLFRLSLGGQRPNPVH